MSLGANSLNGYDKNLHRKLSSDQERFLKLISAQSTSIGVRGYFTAEVLKRLGILNVRVLGCPSYYEEGPNRKVHKGKWDPHRIATTGDFSSSRFPLAWHLLQDEVSLVRTLYDIPGSQGDERQSEPEHVSLRTNLDLTESLNLTLRIILGRIVFFSDFSQWEGFLKRNDVRLTIGTRLHSAIFSINRGIPAFVTNKDARARETCEYLGIPWDPSVDRASDLESLYDTLDTERINTLYPSLHRHFTEFIGENGLAQSTPVDESARDTQLVRLREKAGSDIFRCLAGDIAALMRDVENTCDELCANRQKLKALQLALHRRSVRLVLAISNRIQELPRLWSLLRPMRSVLRSVVP